MKRMLNEIVTDMDLIDDEDENNDAADLANNGNVNILTYMGNIHVKPIKRMWNTLTVEKTPF